MRPRSVRAGSTIGEQRTFRPEPPRHLGADVAGCLWLRGERAATQPADGRVELGYAHLEAGVRVGDGEPARIDPPSSGPALEVSHRLIRYIPVTIVTVNPKVIAART